MAKGIKRWKFNNKMKCITYCHSRMKGTKEHKQWMTLDSFFLSFSFFKLFVFLFLASVFLIKHSFFSLWSSTWHSLLLKAFSFSFSFHRVFFSGFCIPNAQEKVKEIKERKLSQDRVFFSICSVPFYFMFQSINFLKDKSMCLSE